ncbi:MAG: MATE family efflux transporter [Alphaproteobacteria bacterium]|nr:MATE family efflux transporter [Alphaproteobacteria bacterium]
MKKEVLDVTNDGIFKVFFHYTIPWVLGMLAFSSATIVDGMFLGKIVGVEALAALNFAGPVITIFFGISIMISVGSSVRCGKYLGEKKTQEASAMFTKTMLTSIGAVILFSSIGVFYSEQIIALMGGDATMQKLAGKYLSIFSLFSVFILCLHTFSNFIRLEGHPIVASAALIGVAATNVFLDWIFISQLQLGIKGAALASGIAHAIGFLCLFSYFLSLETQLKFTKKLGDWREMWSACWNGSSEFINEASVAVVTIIFNWVLIKRLGVDGVAAFTVINHLLFFELMIVYGFGDAIKSIISINYGARNDERINSFLSLTIAIVVLLGCVMATFLCFFPEKLISLFLNHEDKNSMGLALSFASFFWPVFIFNGASIALSSYFTSMHKPFASVIVAISRSLILPSFFVLFLPRYIGATGIYMSAPLAEFLTFLIASILLFNLTPRKLVQQEVRSNC